MDFKPYQWQTECLKYWIDAGYKGIADVVTGAGKTGLAMMAIRNLKETLKVPLHVLVIVPTCALQDQWIKELHRFFPEQPEIGRVGNGVICNEMLPFQVFVINTARTLLPLRRNRIHANGGAVLLIADECHHYGAKENRKIFDRIICNTDRYFTLGLSSTPESHWLQDVLIPGLGPIIYHYGHGVALSDRIVAPFCIQHIAVSFSCAELNQYADLSDRITALHGKLLYEHRELETPDSADFFRRLSELEGEEDPTAMAYCCLLRKRKEVVGLAESRLQCTVDLLEHISPESRIIIFCERIEQANQLYQFLSKHCRHQVSRYHSGQDPMKNRNEIRDFREKVTRILVTCRALDEGVDVPSADVAVVMSCTAMQRQRIQRLGRILRKGNDGKNAVLYYLYIHESSEENSYLSINDKQIPYTYYRYLPSDHTFYCPEFDRLLDALLEKTRKKGATKKQMEEIIRLAMNGMLRADWQRSSDLCACLQRREPEKENYWRVMKWLAGEKENKESADTAESVL